MGWRLSIPQLSYSQSVGGEGTNRHELPAADAQATSLHLTYIHTSFNYTVLTSLVVYYIGSTSGLSQLFIA
jgi:hypothetical protein